MTFFKNLDLQQRFNLTVFVSIVMASCLLVFIVYSAMAKYATDYTSHYWQEYAKTFAESVAYPVIMGSTFGPQDIAQSFAANQSVLRASIFTPQHKFFVSSDHTTECRTSRTDFSNPFFVGADKYWCFYSPISQNGKTLGHIEMVISKKDLKTILRDILLTSVIIILVFSACILGIVRRFSALFTTTLVEISTVLKNASLGVRGGRVSFSGAADINLMRDTFNDLLTQIELNERQLEERVADRTSELKIALDGSQSANQYKSQIMALVTHEMITPLNAISSFLQLSIEEIPKEEEYDIFRTFNTRAFIRVNELKGLIDNILLQAKSETNRHEVSSSTFTILPLIQGCVEKQSILQNRNQNRLQISGQNLTIYTDPELLTHIINNLLSNACKFTQDGEINLTWWLDHSDLVIQMSDTGCGIPEEFRSQIFDAFWQVDMSLSRKYGGIGLGLAISDKFVQLLGGTISVKDNEGKGTIFTVRIPSSTG